MRRRDVLAGTAAAAVAGLSTPAVSQGRLRLRMVTDWPEGPGLLPSARRFAATIGDATEGRIEIEVYASGELVGPFETFDAVAAGVADMYHSHEGYFSGKSRALHFFSGVPFGFTAGELFAWVRFGGGQALWDELAGQFGVKSLLCSSTGPQMGGWFVREIASLDDFRGLRYRMAEPGAEVLRRLGAVVVVLAGTDIVPALQSGAIDACEWIGPWMDLSIGLHEAASHYYYPGGHEPAGALSLGINRRTWDGLAPGDRRLFEAVAAGEFATSLAEFDANNARALGQLRRSTRVRVEPFNAAILDALRTTGREVVAEAGATDQLTRRIHASYQDFLRSVSDWTDISSRAYLNARGAMP